MVAQRAGTRRQTEGEPAARRTGRSIRQWMYRALFR
jgi:hypothetical protein